MASRAIEDLTPAMQEAYYRFEAEMQEAGLSFAVTCTARTAIEQTALYAQGRNGLDQVNRLRARAGLLPIGEEENRRKVTWTLASKHIVKEERQKSRAFDIVLLNGKKAHWDLKADVNDNEVRDYEEAGRIGESVGLRWGGKFSAPDMVHFEECQTKEVV